MSKPIHEAVVIVTTQEMVDAARSSWWYLQEIERLLGGKPDMRGYTDPKSEDFRIWISHPSLQAAERGSVPEMTFAAFRALYGSPRPE